MPWDFVYRVWPEREGLSIHKYLLIVCMPGMVLRASDEMASVTDEVNQQGTKK